MAISWNDFQSYTNQLLNKIRRSRYVPDIIVAVGISGFFPAAIIAKGLNISNIEIIVISSYSKNRKRSSPKVIFSGLSHSLKDKNVLVVDDIIASGETFALVNEKIMLFKPNQIKFSVSVVSKFMCKKYPDYWGKSIMRDHDDFISFPWDKVV